MLRGSVESFVRRRRALPRTLVRRARAMSFRSEVWLAPLGTDCFQGSTSLPRFPPIPPSPIARNFQQMLNMPVVSYSVPPPMGVRSFWENALRELRGRGAELEGERREELLRVDPRGRPFASTIHHPLPKETMVELEMGGSG